MGRPKKTAARKPPPAASARPAALSVRGLSEGDWLALERAVARRAGTAGEGEAPLDAVVLDLVRRACAQEDARDAAAAGAARDDLVRRLIEARRAVEASARDGWPGTTADRVALVAAQEEAFVALARDAGMAS